MRTGHNPPMHQRRRGLRAALTTALAGALGMTVVTPAHALVIPQSFVSLSKSRTLYNPGILVIDPVTGDTIFAKGAEKLRAPASVLKLISTTTALRAFGADKKFVTTINATAQPDAFVLTGESDPWLTDSAYEAKKYHRAYAPELVNKVLEKNPQMHEMTLYYKDVYATDAAGLKRFFKGRVAITTKVLPGASAVKELVTEPIASISSPPLSEIVDFTLLWSDNVLADRLAHSAAHQLGFPGDATGLQSAFEKTLSDLSVPSEGLSVQDGNGLSHETRVSARTIASLLVAIKREPDLKVIYDGLPTAGKTGTLKGRFVKDAPSAVGLVRAKTGWIDTTVSLAGYVTVGPQQYVFAVIADRIPNRESARGAARVTIDKMLSTIAKRPPASSTTTP
jgi:serine-type D-Ala-D-Ala carboxypeptidase/endopeptidase (penicillin-binding protein 4)